MNSAPLLEFRNASLARDGRVALHSVTFSIALGEHVAILGPNGSGKSSLIKAITRECYPLLGGPDSFVRILGERVWDVFALRSLLGIVSNDLMQTCTRDFSAREIVLSGFFGSVGIWPHHHVTGAMEQKTRETLELLEIPHLAERRVDEMSSGEARRVLIGRALVHDPSALVLDEPTNSLDFRASQTLRDALRKIAQSGISLIIATHHLPDIVPEVRRVILLKDGRVVRDGPKERVLAADPLSELFGAKVEVLERAGYYHVL